jgi:hypothetical protein
MIQLFFCNMINTVEVFKTNVSSRQEADMIIELLRHIYPFALINFDLEDCDKILRIKGIVSAKHVIEVCFKSGYFCEELI